MIGFLYYYFPSLRSLFSFFYLQGFAKQIRRFSLTKFIIIVGLFIVVTAKLNFGVAPAFLWLRLFFGLWFITALPKRFFKHLKRYLPLLALWTIVEYFLFQIFPNSVGNWPNYINTEGAIANYYFSGFFAGPYSWGGNRTITGVISLSLFIYESKRLRKFLFLFSTIFSFSTTAILLLSLYMGIKYWKSVFLMSPLLFYGFSQVDLGYRLSVDYVYKILFQYKLIQWEKALEILNNHHLLGNGNVTSENLTVSNYGLYFGDFMMLDLLSITGMVGLLLFILIVFQKATLKIIVPLMVLFVGSFHYHVLFCLPGQLIFGYLINDRK